VDEVDCRPRELRYASRRTGFQEGLSLTIHDEITRYCKYVYGCSEMLFNPCRQWLRKGVFSKLFLTYIGLRTIPWYTKVVCLTHAISSEHCRMCETRLLLAKGNREGHRIACMKELTGYSMRGVVMLCMPRVE